MSRLVRRLLGERVYIKFKPLGHYPDYLWWMLRGKPVRSPHLLKQRTVAEYGRRYNLRCLVETGTYYGEMVAALCQQFDQVYSIEFDPKLAEYSRVRFKNYPRVKILEGDSGVWCRKSSRNSIVPPFSGLTLATTELISQPAISAVC